MSTNFYWTTSSTGNDQECYWNTSEDTLLDVWGATKCNRLIWHSICKVTQTKITNYRTKSGELIEIFL